MAAELRTAAVIQSSTEALLRKFRSNYELLKGFQDADAIHANLRLWRSVLKDLDARKNKDTSVHNLKKDIRDLVCTLQDFLQIYSSKVQSRRGRGIKNSFRRCITLFDDIISFRSVHFEVEEINTRIMRTIKILKDLNILAVTKTEEEKSHSANGNPEPENRQKSGYSSSLSPEVHIVGMDDEFETLGSVLRDGYNRVICIYGTGGIGKTTLARKLFSDPMVEHNYGSRVWINMDQDITMESVLVDMANQIGLVCRENDRDLDIEELLENVYKSLKGTRYLVVADDIWRLDVLDFLTTILPNHQNGSKLMFTTRLREVATYVAGDDQEGLIHKMRYLSKSESSELFWKKALLGDPQEVDLFKKQIGEEVLDLCQGLPSAIVAVGEVLATKHTLSDWEMVLQDTKSLMRGGLPVDQIVFGQSISALSFDDLPYHLKPCFLYLGLFPKGSRIEAEHLYLLWIAEGMISRDDCQNNETMMDLAERYLSDLVQRKMVEVEEEETTSLRKYKSCWVHEHMQDHCLLQGEEYFFKVLERRSSDSLSSTTNPARRMALHLGKQDDDRSVVDHFKKEKFNRLRSLLLLNLRDLQMKLELPRRMFYPKKYTILRVLYFERVDFQEKGLPRGMAWPIYLKYLSFKGCILGVLPTSVGNLSFLEILDLRVSGEIIIPNVLRKLGKLIYLYLPLTFQTPNNNKLYLGSLKEIEILENLNTGLCNVDDLFEMKSLRYLSTTVEGILGDLEQIVRRMGMTSENTSVLYPSIKVNNFDCYTEERHSVFRKLLNCQILHTLYMVGHLGQIPLHYKITSSLTEMILIGSELKEDPMATLDKVPKLQVLVLQDDAFVGKKMICVKSGFKKLKRLELSTLRFLETWEVEKESMPMLSVLAVKNCKNLQIPPQHELRNRFPSKIFENGN